MTTPPKFWLPSLSTKQFEIFNAFDRYLLVSGPRRSGKTLGILHKLVRHAYDVNGARPLILAKNIKLAKEGGPWTDLIDIVIPEWEREGILEMVTPPKLDTQTRSLYCEITNRYGGKTRIYLGSLEFDDDAEKILRGRRFSLIYVVEATNFKKRSLFDTAIQCLRMPQVPQGLQQIVFDCNPADEGDAHWLYRLFWGERLAATPPEQHKTDKQKEQYRSFQRCLRVIEVMIPDNPFLTQPEIDELYAQFSYDEGILARYFYGKWITSSNEGYFAQHFKPAIHVLGNVMRPERKDWEVILIPEDTLEMYCGWDLGDRYSVVTFACKEKDAKGHSTYSFVDEIVVENDSVRLEDFVEAVFKVMSKWEEFVGHGIQWRHWSDTSSFVIKLSAQNHEAALIEEISQRIVSHGAFSPTRIIRLRPVNKYHGSVKDGIKLMKRLLFENRLYVSANCIHLIQMFRSFKPERARGTGVERVPDNEWTHKFDSARYLVQSEEPVDVMFTRSRVGKSPGRIISMG